MKYMGSKSKIAKYILPIILKDRLPNQWYVEPFCGGCNSIDKVNGLRLAADNNKYLIALWKGLQLNLNRPYNISKDLYDNARIEFYNNSNINFTDFEIGWIGYMASFNGRFFDGGYSGIYKKRNYIREQINNTEKQLNLISDINFIHSNYSDLIIPNNSIIYCDIPYLNTKKYYTSSNFNYDDFWSWCRYMKSLNHSIFISEYNAPSDFIPIWEMKVTNSLNTKNTYKPIEKLFKL